MFQIINFQLQIRATIFPIRVDVDDRTKDVSDVYQGFSSGIKKKQGKPT